MKQLHIIVVVVGALLSSSCTTQPVSYRNDVVPIIESRCSKCHTPPDGVGYTATGLSMVSYDALMSGTFYGPVVVAGDSRRSIFNMLVEGRAGKMQRMPHQEEQGLSDAQIETLKNWVNEGALDN